MGPLKLGAFLLRFLARLGADECHCGRHFGRANGIDLLVALARSSGRRVRRTLQTHKAGELFGVLWSHRVSIVCFGVISQICMPETSVTMVFDKLDNLVDLLLLSELIG